MAKNLKRRNPKPPKRSARMILTRDEIVKRMEELPKRAHLIVEAIRSDKNRKPKAK